MDQKDFNKHYSELRKEIKEYAAKRNASGTLDPIQQTEFLMEKVCELRCKTETLDEKQKSIGRCLDSIIETIKILLDKIRG